MSMHSVSSNVAIAEWLLEPLQEMLLCAHNVSQQGAMISKLTFSWYCT